jgi:hypothetical protein
LLLRERALQRGALARKAGQLRAQLPALAFELIERAVGLRNGPLAVAQRVARLPAGGLLLAQLGRKQLDALA